jgi:methionyl-tRNA formyltransferase
MKMDAGIDTGDIISTEVIPIGEKETYGELLNRLSNLGAGCIIRALDNISNWTFTPQDNENATYAPMLHRDDCRINWADSAQNIVNHIRGLNPDPSAFAIINGKPRKIYEADTQGEGIIVRDGLVITKLRAESGKIISGIDFLRGNTIESIE